VYATNKTGSSSDDWIYYQMVTHSLINYTYTMAIEFYLSFTPIRVHRCTHTLVVSQRRISKHTCKSYTLQIFPINLLFTEAVFSTHADNSLRTKLADLYSTRALLLYYYSTILLVHYWPANNFTSH
jgi:hypothetical protein